MTEFNSSDFAGFSKRFAAFVIDIMIVSFIVFPFALMIGLISPNSIVVEVPLGLFTTSTTISENSDNNTSIEKEEVLGLWTNYYQITETKNDEGETSTSRELVEPVTHLRINKKTTSSDIEFCIIFIYWILLEASVWQASLGKKIMGILVVTQDGGRPDIFQCMARNLFKLLSIIILFIGFLMAAWTDKKQALHDKIPNLLIINGSHNRLREQDVGEADGSA